MQQRFNVLRSGHWQTLTHDDAALLVADHHPVGVHALRERRQTLRELLCEVPGVDEAEEAQPAYDGMEKVLLFLGYKPAEAVAVVRLLRHAVSLTQGQFVRTSVGAYRYAHAGHPQEVERYQDTYASGQKRFLLAHDEILFIEGKILLVGWHTGKN
jgi:hypothetical protein